MPTFWLRNRTDPSPKQTFMPPGCMLPKGTSLYGTIKFALKIELIGFVTLRQLTTNAGRPAITPAYSSPPRTQVLNRVPYGADTHDISAIMTVLEVPSVTLASLIVPSR